ncbi:hypothetical protein Tco_0132585 [Tanacetum coccineum]
MLPAKTSTRKASALETLKVSDDEEEDLNGLPSTKDLPNTLASTSLLRKKDIDVKLAREKAGQKERIATIESKCECLEKERATLRETKIKLREEIDGLNLQCRMLKQDRADVATKLVPYIGMELYHSDVVGLVLGNMVKSAIFHCQCKALEEVVETKNTVDLSKVQCYCASTEMEYEEADNAYITEKYSFSPKQQRTHQPPYKTAL